MTVPKLKWAVCLQFFDEWGVLVQSVQGVEEGIAIFSITFNNGIPEKQVLNVQRNLHCVTLLTKRAELWAKTQAVIFRNQNKGE